KAWLIARDADARREREVRWSHQIEAILEWSSRAKSATTRSQLIGFAHLAPKEAIGAVCLVVAEGGPARHGSHGLPRITLAVVDLDHLKLVNDSLGHPEGDAVLRRAGGAVRTVLRGSDRIYRLGGEEFALLLETVEPAGVAEVLNRAREAIKSLGVEPAP